LNEQPKKRTSNHLLLKVPAAELDKLLPLMELLELDIKDVLYEPGKQIENVYFPDSGCMSIITKLKDGSTVEAITVGKEGMVGLPLFLGATSTPTLAICQVPGKVWRMSAANFLRCIERSKILSTLLRQYTQTMCESLAQSTACNRLHTIEERCARWLLMTQDRMESKSFPLTQEFLATMLGVHRPGVSLVAKTLQQAGLIDYRHGKITVLDRAGLEQICCECYTAVRHGYQFQIDGAPDVR
jgi:CRP-like cAMP-binding protein